MATATASAPPRPPRPRCTSAPPAPGTTLAAVKGPRGRGCRGLGPPGTARGGAPSALRGPRGCRRVGGAAPPPCLAPAPWGGCSGVGAPGPTAGAPCAVPQAWPPVEAPLRLPGSPWRAPPSPCCPPEPPCTPLLPAACPSPSPTSTHRGAPGSEALRAHGEAGGGPARGPPRQGHRCVPSHIPRSVSSLLSLPVCNIPKLWSENLINHT